MRFARARTYYILDIGGNANKKKSRKPFIFIHKINPNMMKNLSENKARRPHRMRYLWTCLIMLIAGTGVTLAGMLDSNVAKVGDTEYATIEEAVAAWGPGKTLTLLQDVTTTSTVTVEVNATKSTQNWTLDLGDHTWTADGCNAFQLYAAGGTVMNQNYGLIIYANQNGGITASGKYCIECKYDNSTAGYRPRLEIHGGTYNGSYIICGITRVFPMDRQHTSTRAMTEQSLSSMETLQWQNAPLPSMQAISMGILSIPIPLVPQLTRISREDISKVVAHIHQTVIAKIIFTAITKYFTKQMVV